MTIHRNILLVDSNAESKTSFTEKLGYDFKVSCVYSYDEVRLCLSRNYSTLSIIIVNYDSVRSDCEYILNTIRDNPVTSQIPLLLITRVRQIPMRVLCSGVISVIDPEIDAEQLVCVLKNIIRLRETSSIFNHTYRDQKTGLLSSESFFSQAEKSIRAKAGGYYVLSAIDVENFKMVNDQYGREKGDQVLRYIARLLMQLNDQYGGLSAHISADNFVMLMPAKNIDDNVIVQKRGEVDALIPRLAFNVGRYYIDDPSLPIRTMYDRALVAKDSIKSRYDNHFAIYDHSMRQKLFQKQFIVSNMRHGLNNNEFEVWFQPQFDLRTDSLCGAEALVRWYHPGTGQILPDEFIPIFEQNGFIYDMDKCIWMKSCHFLRRCLDETGIALPVSINVSRYDIMYGDVVKDLSELIKSYSLRSSLLHIEITESSFMGDTDKLISFVNQLVNLGFEVEIDDFGSGYSSLNTLKDVPAQIVKLDMRFLSGNDNHPRGYAILRSIVEMIDSIGMSSLVEGIEKPEQLEFLRKIGCKFVQGFLLARPFSADDYLKQITGSVITADSLFIGTKSLNSREIVADKVKLLPCERRSD